jgi:molybdenum cofactor synthesis domain-containing protein
MTANDPTAAVLVIGNEILSGRTQEANLNTIAKKLADVGIPLKEARVVPDVEAEIVAALDALRSRYTYVFTTGGIGPTHDDITVDSVAKAFKVPVVENAKARALLASSFGDKGLTTARLRMARVPEGASLVNNPISGAPGVRIGNVFVLAGVPEIMRAMMDDAVSTLRHGPKLHTATVEGNVAESLIAEELRALAARFPNVDIGSYPWMKGRQIGTALVARGTDATAVRKVADDLLALMKTKDEKATRTEA